MADNNTFRYIKLDFQSHKDALLQRVRDRYPGVWNDFLANSFGIVLVDIVAWGFATLAYVMNKLGAENYVSTMTLRESAVRIGKLTGYTLRGNAPATVMCEASLTTVNAANVSIQAGTQIHTSTTEGIPFEVAYDYVIEAGERSPKTLVAIFSASQTGTAVVGSNVVFTNNSTDVDVVDTTLDISQIVSVGQTINRSGSSDVYVIQGLEKAPGSVSDYSRIVLDRAYTSITETAESEVYDRRIAFVQGQSITDVFTAPASSTSGYSVALSRYPVMLSTVEVTVNNVLWSQVDVLGVQSSEAEVYQVQTFVNGSSAVLFGDDLFGKAIPPEATVQVRYRIGGGLDGNIDLSSISTTITGYTTAGVSVSVSIVNNTSTGIGGQDAETLDQARVNIPAHTRTNDRAVTLSDYQTMAQQFNSAQYGSVSYARSAVRTENSFLEGNIVAIYAWTTGNSGGLVNLSPQLKSALQTYLQTKAVGTDLVQVYDGTNRPVPVSFRFKTLPGFSITDTKRLVLDTLKSRINSLRPGDPLYYSDLMRALDEVYGVDTLTMATPSGDLVPSNSLELFAVPQDNFVYSVDRNGDGVPETDTTGTVTSKYVAQLPVFPLAAWSVRLFLGTNELTITPYVQSGYARLFGTNLSSSDSSRYHSLVNLLTGQVTLWLKGTPGDLTMKLNTAAGYSVERVINVYVGYEGDNTSVKRQEIRAALKAWSDGLPIGGIVYAREVSGIAVSKVSITNVVSAISGVDSVTRVALDTPSSSSARITALDFELPRLGNIVLNNNLT